MMLKHRMNKNSQKRTATPERHPYFREPRARQDFLSCTSVGQGFRCQCDMHSPTSTRFKLAKPPSLSTYPATQAPAVKNSFRESCKHPPGRKVQLYEFACEGLNAPEARRVYESSQARSSSNQHLLHGWVQHYVELDALASNG